MKLIFTPCAAEPDQGADRTPCQCEHPICIGSQLTVALLCPALSTFAMNKQVEYRLANGVIHHITETQHAAPTISPHRTKHTVFQLGNRVHDAGHADRAGNGCHCQESG